jgi:ribosomal protein S18 acetylase RimI-like enzyme
MADSVDHAIRPLAPDHDGSAFDCGEQWLNNYIRQHAARNQKLGYGRTYAATPAGSNLIDGYYTLAMGSVVFEHLPPALSERVPKYPMPVVHLACLAVDARMQGQGLGGILLIDAFRRAVSAADIIAARALDVKAISQRARRWYVDRGFLTFRDNPDHLYLPLDTVRATIAHL